MDKLCEHCKSTPVKLKVHKYCSRACFFEASKRQVEKSCKECGKVFYVAKSRAVITTYKAGTYCSKTCMGRFMGRVAVHNGKLRYEHNGYVYVKAHDHPNRIKNGYIAEHRLVMEKKIGRLLLRSESVHHVNCIKNDNRPENLELVASGVHLGGVDCPNCKFHFKLR
jgi:ssDNA-binding Zn-finger/Zn-ribbon topoisomerase 1